MICLTPKTSKSFFVYRIESKGNFFFLQKKSFLKKNGSDRLNKKRKDSI